MSVCVWCTFINIMFIHLGEMLICRCNSFIRKKSQIHPTCIIHRIHINMLYGLDFNFSTDD